MSTRIDLYTKTVLTVIAGCLVWICVATTPVGIRVEAQGSQVAQQQRVIIAGWIDDQGRQHLIQSTLAGIPVVARSETVTAGVVSTPAPAPSPASPVISTAPPRAPAPTATQRVQCAATTQAGRRCSRLAEVGGAFCWQHKGH